MCVVSALGLTTNQYSSVKHFLLLFLLFLCDGSRNNSWNPPSGSPVAYGGKPAYSAGFTATRCLFFATAVAHREDQARCFKSAKPTPGASSRRSRPTHWLPQDRAASPLQFVKKIDFDKEF
ncbi:hypothetical protein [Nostoc sp.]|uniref:hypothetical protein n=1 Tax=Nostoc sp. TaxID=1180 RepID=UPI002FF47844